MENLLAEIGNGDVSCILKDNLNEKKNGEIIFSQCKTTTTWTRKDQLLPCQ